jgi:glycopeptide antibiotics resistance protein
LITSVRSTDIDDVILNTSGAIIGYVLYKLFRLG